MSPLVMCNLVSHSLAELRAPLPDRFVGHHDPALQHHLFDLRKLSGNR